MDKNESCSWVEKYRPKCLDDVYSQEDVINPLKVGLKKKNIPHLIFFGPSGSGKTSTILALGKELFGDLYSERIIELNASDERGINIVRGKIKRHAQYAIRDKKGGGLPPWKIIILDEADTMTPDSQFALRRIMEEYSKITRFCIICNYHNKIIDPIVSRCSMHRFRPIPNKLIIERLESICKAEKFKCNKKLLEKIVKICRGDLRKAINFLQRCHNTLGDDINEALLDEISGIIPYNILVKLVGYALEKKSKKVDKYISDCVKDGYSLVNQITSLSEILINHDEIESKEKSQIMIKLTEIDNNLIKGCDEYIQFMRLFYFIMSEKKM
jgi:replication factor C subunit 2/4